jgi:hypothetical protein
MKVSVSDKYNSFHGPMIKNFFTAIIYEYTFNARVFVLVMPYQSSLLFEGKTRSLP